MREEMPVGGAPPYEVNGDTCGRITHQMIRFVHTNLVAHDWRALAQFYQDVFECEPLHPERKLSGADYARGTGLPGAVAEGIHLRLPGHGESGPTLEIFQYAEVVEGMRPVVNRPGLGHLAFAVESVRAVGEKVLFAGGTAVGEIVETRISPTVVVTWCYVRDPEGNLVELQSKLSDT